jgi:DNA-binding FadR family transcriptional regulator
MWSSHGLRLAVLRAQNLDAIYREHAAVAAAIRRRAPDGARDAMLHHIEAIRVRVERMFGPGQAAAATDALSRTLPDVEERAGETRWVAVAGASG